MVSDQANGLGTYHWYYLNAKYDGSTLTNNWMDYPYIGYSGGYSGAAIYLTGTMIDFNSGYWQYDKIRILDKTPVYAGQAVGWWDFVGVYSNNTYDFDIAPAQQLTNEGVEYLVNSQTGGSNYLTVRRITNQTDFVNGPVMSTEVVPVTNYTLPPAARQPDGTTSLENTDCRLLGATLEFGRLNTIGETGANFGAGTNSALKIYRLNVNPSSSSVDRDYVYGFTSYDAFYPAIQGTQDGDQIFAFDYSGSGAGSYASIAVNSWANFDGGPAGAIQTKGGEGDYSRIAQGRNRWGDYSTTALDPYDFRTVWFTSEYPGATNFRSTWVNAVNLKPNTSLTVSNVTAAPGQTVTLGASLTDQNGYVIPSQGVDFYIDSTYVGSATTDASGNASLSYADTYGVGSHSLSATFSKTSIYNGTTGYATLTVVRAGSSTVATSTAGAYGQSVYLYATLTRTTDGAALVGSTVSFKVGTAAAGSAITDASGLASRIFKVPTTLAPGSQTIIAKFAGDFNNNPSIGSATLSVSKASTSINVPAVSGATGQTVILKATLKRSTDHAGVASETITFKIDATTVGTASTLASGTASLSYVIPSTLSTGTHKITAGFAGDVHYTASTGHGTLTKH